MGWRDDFGLLNSVVGSSSYRPARGYQTYNARAKSYGVDTRASRPESINWSNLASGRLGGVSGSSTRTRQPPTHARAYPSGGRAGGLLGGPDAPIERLDFKYPYSSTGVRGPYEPPPPEPVSTQGDVLQSVTGAVGSVAANLDLANAIPWLMERVNTFAEDMAASTTGLTSDAFGAVDWGTDRFIDAVDAVSQPVAAVLSGFPDWVRDSQLGDRAKLYRALANGEVPDYGLLGPASNPLGTLDQLSYQFNPFDLRRITGIEGHDDAALFGRTVSSQAQDAAHWQSEILQAVDPQRKLHAEARMAILRDSIDLPESVKREIERKPRATDEELAKWMDDAPEGRSWSYTPGLKGDMQRIGTPLLFFIAEARAGARVGSEIGALGSALRAGSGTVGAAGTALGLAGRGVSTALRIETAAVASGAALTGVNVAMGSIARFVGDEEAIAWWDHANRTTPFSDDPMVQLATGFAVNPLAAARNLKAGTLTLKHGLVEVPIDAMTRGKMLRLYTNEDRIADLTKRMFGLGSREEAVAFMAEEGLRPMMPDRILGAALDIVFSKLPREERLAFNDMHADPVGRTSAAVQRYQRRAMQIIEKDPDQLRARFLYDWQYRMSTLAFEPRAAARIARNFRLNEERTYDIRAEQRAVLSYRDYLPPQGQSAARAAVDEATVNGMVPQQALTDLAVDLPVITKYLGGRVKSTDALIPRAIIDQIIDDAAADWAHAAKVNPIKVATGTDPVIRPSSPSLMRDYAEAMGTDVRTMEAITDFDGGAAHVGLLQRFLVGKGVVDDVTAANLGADDALAKATDYFTTTTRPWRETGARLDGAEKQLDNLRGELARVQREYAKSSRLHDMTERMEKQIKELESLIRDAGDPVRPFSQLAGEARTALPDLHLAEMAARKVDALDRLRTLETVSADLKTAALSEADLTRIVRGADGELQDIYEVLGAPPTAVDSAFLSFKTANMYVVKSLKTAEAATRGILSSKRQSVRELSNKGAEFVRYHEAAPASYKWAAYADSPGFIAGMRKRGDEVFGREYDGLTDRVVDEGMTGNQIADMVEAAALARGVTGASLDDIAAAWGITRDEALARMSGLKTARAAALDGQGVSPATLRRSADLKVPEDYVVQAEANRAARELVYDAEYEAFWHPRNVAKVQDITDRADELWPALREVAAADPAIMEGIERVAAATVQRTEPPAGRGTAYFRGSDSAATAAGKRIATGSDWWDSHLFVASTERDARLYGQEIERIIFSPGARILTEGTKAFQRFNARALKDAKLSGRGSMLDWAENVARQAEAAGYDAVHFRDQGAIGTVVLNKGVVTRGGTSARAATVDDVFADPSYAAAVRKELIPDGFKPPAEGVISETATELDQLVMAGDAAGIAAMAEQLASLRAQPRVVQRLSKRAAEQMAKVPKQRRSYQYRSTLSNAGARFTESPADYILSRAENKVGLDVLSVLNHGVTGTKPATLRGVIGLLEEIENGNAGRMGFGPELQAEAQRVAREILDDGVRAAKRNPENIGTFGMGMRVEDEQALAAELDHLLSYDRADPMGTLAYGLSKPPKDAIVLEWSQVPGLAEEMLTKAFQPYTQRALTTKVREAFGFVFGPHSNEVARAEIKLRFVERGAREGLSETLTSAIWERWAKLAHDSRRPSLRVTKEGRRTYESGDNPLYADIWNIPNNKLDSLVHGDPSGKGVLYDLRDAGEISHAEAAAAESLDFAHLFREAASFTRRTLKDKVPLGDALAWSYGRVAHNEMVTTHYYWFRFAVDIRYHAMNYLEAQILHAGAAGLKKGEIDEGLLGMSEGYLRKMDLDPVSNTGYQFSRDRMRWAYRTFLKQQPDRLRQGLRTVAKDEPALMKQVVEELAQYDPQLQDMIQNLDGTPDPTKFLGALNDWHGKMLRNVDETGDAKTIDEALAVQMADDPALAELYDRLAVVNKEHWSDIRATFYGNPNRSRAERMLNSYLLFWPLSYQIKSTKWFAKVLFDRAGGIQTNALGAVTLDRIAETHNRLVEVDPEYRDWYEKHDTLVFMAQMLFPVSLESTGVSLNPLMRGLLFGRDPLKAMEIGPIYTYNRVIRPIAGELGADIPEVDLWPTVGAYSENAGTQKVAPRPRP
jgi:hypothetical protein